MNTAIMERAKKHLSLDTKVVDGINRKRIELGMGSFSHYVEAILAAHLIAMGELPPNYQNPGEFRGGDRTKPKAATVEPETTAPETTTEED